MRCSIQLSYAAVLGVQIYGLFLSGKKKIEIMTVELWSLGKQDKKELAAAIELYIKRLSFYTKFKLETIDNAKVNTQQGKEQILDKESELILSKLNDKDILITLDEKGKSVDSIEFSKKLNQWMNQSSTRIVFLIGGSYGISAKVHERAIFKMALSALTFPHQLVRLIFTEQLYRAFSILNNEKYHHA